MQDNWQEFDRQFKSVLQDAEVKAPRRVWRAVSARLRQAEAAAAWWRWAVPAFAAAALVAGLFFAFNGKGPASPAESIIVAQNVTGEAPSAAETDSAPVVDFQEPSGAPVSAVAPAASGRRPLVASVVPAASSAQNRPAAASQPSEPAQASPAESSEAVPSEGQTPSGVTPATTPSTDSPEAVSAQWAAIEQEDARHVGNNLKFSGMYARGGVGGNDSNISYGGTGISKMAPGAGSPDAGIGETSTSTYGVPFTVGLGARFHVAPKLSIGTGLDYSLLTRTFKGTYSDSYTGGIYHAVQYVGIPVNAYYDILSTRDGLLNLYAWGGGSAEVCVSNKYRLMSDPGTVVKDAAGALQFSAALGIGVEIPLSGKLSLYLDPAVRYYFHGNQPKSLRTDKPFMFNFDAGLRFNL